MGSRLRMPERYQATSLPAARFHQRVEVTLRPGMAILDIGAGHEPTVAPSARPPGCHYVGMDISADELDRAPTGSYDECVISDVATRDPRLLNRFDVVLSFQVFEHVRPLDDAIENLRHYLRPSGVLIAMLTGKLTYFAMLNRFLPQKLKFWLLSRFHGYDSADIFPAYYDRCYHRALVRCFRDWESCDIGSFHLGASYLSFCAPLCRTYLVFENWAARTNQENLASNYVVLARR